MPINELHLLEELLSKTTITEKQLIDRSLVISKAWEVAAFSRLPQHSLMRYFDHQLKGLIDIVDKFFEYLPYDPAGRYQSLLLKQIDHLIFYYSSFFNWDTQAPVTFHQRTIDRLTTSVIAIRNGLASSLLSPALSRCLLNWLNEATECGTSVRYTFRSLNYLEKIISHLSVFHFDAAAAETSLILLLSSLNFNHLAFLAFRQNKIVTESKALGCLSVQLDFLQHQKASVLACPEARGIVYDPSFPSIKAMLSNWLQEQVTLSETALKKEMEARPERQQEKQSLDLSVAHLACLIKLFLEENIFVSRNTKGVFQFFAANFQTKRQTAISSGSLSKEFYSIDQHTAARVRDMLQKMILRINRNFFPVMAAISTVTLFHPGTH